MFPFQEKNVSDDVHLQTIDNLMGGIESVIGGVHRHVMLEIVSYYDKKFIEKWFLHDEAANLLAIKSQRLAMKEHYTRLYGPRVTVAKTDSWLPQSAGGDTKNRIQTYVPPTESNGTNPSTAIAMTSNDDSKTLKLAFDSHPYSVYSNKVAQPNYEHAESPTVLEDCVQEREKRTSMLWDKAFSGAKRTSLTEKRKSVPVKELEKLEEKEEEVDKIIEVYQKVRLQSQSSVTSPLNTGGSVDDSPDGCLDNKI